MFTPGYDPVEDRRQKSLLPLPGAVILQRCLLTANNPGKTMAGVILDETKKIVRKPKRLLQVFYPRRWRQFLGILLFNARSGNRWKAAAEGAQFKQREYGSYEEYVRHQQSKFQYLDLRQYDVDYRRQLKDRLKDQAFVKKGATVICLGARQGTEVEAFLDLGCFAVGIDLNPGRENAFVVYGDFHRLQFPDASADVVFTNSFDHSFDAGKLIAEIARVLKPDGTLVIEAIRGGEEKSVPDHYASFWWDKVDDLVALLAAQQFKAVRRMAFAEPWPGEQICFEKQV